MDSNNIKINSNTIKYNNVRDNNYYGFYLDGASSETANCNNIDDNLIKELYARYSDGNFEWNWWGTTSDPRLRMTIINSIIDYTPQLKQPGPPWKKVRTVPSLYLPRIFEQFPLLRLLFQR